VLAFEELRYNQGNVELEVRYNNYVENVQRVGYAWRFNFQENLEG
jgi:hypothetical protein